MKYFMHFTQFIYYEECKLLSAFDVKRNYVLYMVHRVNGICKCLWILFSLIVVLDSILLSAGVPLHKR